MSIKNYKNIVHTKAYDLSTLASSYDFRVAFIQELRQTLRDLDILIEHNEISSEIKTVMTLALESLINEKQKYLRVARSISALLITTLSK